MKPNIWRFRAGMTALLLITSGLLCSCESLEYTEEQEDKISHYAAQVVLKHDKKYKYIFLPAINDSVSSVQETEEDTGLLPETETTAVIDDGQGFAEQPSGDGTVNIGTDYTDINQVLQVADGISISYAGYDVVATYPTDNAEDLFVIKAVGDSHLLVVRFDVKNTTSQDINVNFMENGKRYKGIVNESKKYNAQLTLLLDAMNTFEGVIPAGQSIPLVLIFQTQLGSNEDLTQLSVSVTEDSGEEKMINLKN